MQTLSVPVVFIVHACQALESVSILLHSLRIQLSMHVIRVCCYEAALTMLGCLHVTMTFGMLRLAQQAVAVARQMWAVSVPLLCV